ncbi:uncharacterized protein F5147DRAFT_769298 [Suillus discolor]|uniref:Uncharacterized protein n=1 Tax=Suillus discolor TaxID=1912936 RepID=A0A9P7FF71_9AGAM|nr:uncharacterized protein F5147DRAFT_769298 [Suillus discolor]KAG2115893.1 hypothetical protein F5147DRAFT_769298 [Suillus discolor]
MRAPVSKESDDSNGDADDEGMWPMPTKKSLAAAAPSPAGVPKVRPRFIKRAHVSSADEESDKTDADVPLPKVNKHAPYRVRKGANATRGDLVGHPSESDDQPAPKSIGKRVRTWPAIISPRTDSAYEDRPIIDLVRQVSHDRGAYAAGKTCMPVAQVTEGSEDESCSHIGTKARYEPACSHHTAQQVRGFGPHSTRQGLEHIRTSPVVPDQTLKKTRAARDVLPAVNNRLPRKTTAPRERSPAINDQSAKKTKVTKSAACSIPDAPAKSTRSKVDNALGTQIRQKPKRYADYV